MLVYEPKGRAREYAPLALNIFRGCGHRCSYCYAPASLKMDRTEFINPAPRKDIIKKLEKELKSGMSLFQPEDKPQVLLCFSCDPYQPLNDSLRLTRKVILLLHDAGYPVHVLTKGGTRAVPDFGLLTKKNDAFATTMTFMNPELSIKYEPNAALPKNRIEAIRIAHDLGIFTWVSLEPVIDKDETLAVIEATHDIVDHYKIGKLNHETSQIDWKAFGEEVQCIMIKLGKSHYIKKDLQDKMDKH